MREWSGKESGYGVIKGKPGNFMVFMDQHYNVIRSFRLDGDSNLYQSRFEETLDLSKLVD